MKGFDTVKKLHLCPTGRGRWEWFIDTLDLRLNPSLRSDGLLIEFRNPFSQVEGLAVVETDILFLCLQVEDPNEES